MYPSIRRLVQSDVFSSIFSVGFGLGLVGNTSSSIDKRRLDVGAVWIFESPQKVEVCAVKIIYLPLLLLQTPLRPTRQLFSTVLCRLTKPKSSRNGQPPTNTPETLFRTQKIKYM
jgi:hypothetical protein